MKNSSHAFLLALVCLAGCVCALPAAAAKPAAPTEGGHQASAPKDKSKDSGQKLLGAFGNWRALSYEEKGSRVCYMTMTGKTAKIKNFSRSDARLIITHRPDEGSRDVVSFAAGYNFKPVSDAHAHIGKEDFNLFTANDTAWARDAATDRKLAAAIRHGTTLTLTGTPSSKKIRKDVTDTLNLSGALSAYNAISKACGYPEDKPPPKAAKTAKKPHKEAKPIKKKTHEHH